MSAAAECLLTRISIAADDATREQAREAGRLPASPGRRPRCLAVTPESTRSAHREQLMVSCIGSCAHGAHHAQNGVHGGSNGSRNQTEAAHAPQQASDPAHQRRPGEQKFREDREHVRVLQMGSISRAGLAVSIDQRSSWWVQRGKGFLDRNSTKAGLPKNRSRPPARKASAAWSTCRLLACARAVSCTSRSALSASVPEFARASNTQKSIQPPLRAG